MTPPVRTSHWFLTSSIVLLCAWSRPAVAQEPSLPFQGTDQIEVLEQPELRSRRLSGRIEDISGETLTLRVNGRGVVELFRITDITEIQFARGPDFAAALELQQQGDFVKANDFIDRELQTETRRWAWNEMQAVAAINEIHLGRRREAVQRIEQIMVYDRRTRHVSLLPLVWDERLPAAERLTATPDELNSESLVTRLCAASALLHEPEHRKNATDVLHRIRRESGLGRINQLAETQLWRLAVLKDSAERNALLNVWDDRLATLPVTTRSGPQFVVARSFQQNFQYDKAALRFLWLPLVSCHDDALAALATKEAVHCLTEAGRLEDADRYQHELQSRFPKESASQSDTKAP